ncbi:MAG: hypothetical protein JWM53_3744 [bacterium]|nr:hypothetical protein [bacterium]
MTDREDGSVRAAWRGVVTAAALSGGGQLAFLVIKLRVVGQTALTWEQGAHALLCAGLVALLVITRRHATLPLCNAVFLATGLPFLLTVWTGEVERAAWGLPFNPFVGEKLVVLAIAFLAPSLWVGSGLIVALALEMALLAKGLGLGAHATAGGEPWITLVYCVVALALLAHRLRRLQLEREIAKLRAEAQASARLARTFHAVRDLANTPLQTVAINLALLEKRPGEPEPLTRIANALARLRELDALLEAGADVPWQPGDESFDPRAILAARR